MVFNADWVIAPCSSAEIEAVAIACFGRMNDTQRLRVLDLVLTNEERDAIADDELMTRYHATIARERQDKAAGRILELTGERWDEHTRRQRSWDFGFSDGAPCVSR